MKRSTPGPGSHQKKIRLKSVNPTFVTEQKSFYSSINDNMQVFVGLTDLSRIFLGDSQGQG